MAKIDAGQTIRIYENGSPIVDSRIPLTLKEDITINLSSTFEPVLSSNDNKWASLLGGISRDLTGIGFSSTFNFQGFQIWKSTEPLSLNITLDFFFGSSDLYSGFEEVYKPIIALASLPLPSIPGISAGTETKLDDVLVPPGPSIITALFPDSQREGTLKGRRFSLNIGNILYISDIIVQKAEPTFSLKNVDDQGYPIRGSINLDIKTIDIATVEMLSKRPSDTLQGIDTGEGR